MELLLFKQYHADIDNDKISYRSDIESYSLEDMFIEDLERSTNPQTKSSQPQNLVSSVYDLRYDTMRDNSTREGLKWEIGNHPIQELDESKTWSAWARFE